MPNAEPKTPQQKVVSLLQAAISDIERGDRIDALDMIRIAHDKIVASLPQLLRPKPEIPLYLEWSPTLGNGSRMSYADAEAACAALGEGWRLPTIQELLSLVDLSRHDPAIDVAAYPNTKHGAYWTRTPVSWAPSAAWVVNFYYGNSDVYLRVDGYAFVRAVRSFLAG